MGIVINPISEGGVTLEAKDDTVSIKGSIDCPKPGEFMGPFLEEVHNQMVKGEDLDELKIDIKELSFLNSSAISELSDLILKLDDLPEEKKYRIKFLCNTKDYAWQRNSITTIAMLNMDLISIEDG